MVLLESPIGYKYAQKTTQIIYLLPIKDKSGNEIISIKQICVENDDFIDEIVRCSKIKYRSEYNWLPK